MISKYSTTKEIPSFFRNLKSVPTQFHLDECVQNE